MEQELADAVEAGDLQLAARRLVDAACDISDPDIRAIELLLRYTAGPAPKCRPISSDFALPFPVPSSISDAVANIAAVGAALADNTLEAEQAQALVRVQEAYIDARQKTAENAGSQQNQPQPGNCKTGLALLDRLGLTAAIFPDGVTP